ncbi:ribonuclease E inhibitor RraA/Dimethylmenaquinone methyltransferase [Glomus cerebriforme]|uniref:Ribonuclease E inhibitor RraA/Dimethylmenaquinone methyltransferase n=1 Tax=Glomus cerebriforme TaxID=658196 RepID=A0A397TIF3_9GLOM|nr:ribonuclease E inhibitor RraA/Dimethylmenaquinone methyltransferase [Glomus cerebriforme]
MTDNSSLDKKLELLKNFTACDVADALLRLNHPLGGYLPNIVMFSPEYQSGDTKLVGPVYTVKIVPKSDTTSPKLATSYADTIPSGNVVFLSAPPDSINAVWGGLMNTRAKILGAKGVVVDGRIRDLEELRSDGIPVFARATSVLSAKEFTRPTALNVPIILNGNHDPPIKINPDDIIFADLDGIVCIPKDLLEQVLDSCEKHVAMDKNLKNALYEGITLTEAKSIHRKE